MSLAEAYMLVPEEVNCSDFRIYLKMNGCTSDLDKREYFLIMEFCPVINFSMKIMSTDMSNFWIKTSLLPLIFTVLVKSFR